MSPSLATHDRDKISLTAQSPSHTVSIFQFGFGLLLAPLLTVPGVGSARGASMAQVREAFGAGWRCFLQRDAGCAHR